MEIASLTISPSRVAEIAEFDDGAAKVRRLRAVGDEDAFVAIIATVARHILE